METLDSKTIERLLKIDKQRKNADKAYYARHRKKIIERSKQRYYKIIKKNKKINKKNETAEKTKENQEKIENF